MGMIHFQPAIQRPLPYFGRFSSPETLRPLINSLQLASQASSRPIPPVVQQRLEKHVAAVEQWTNKAIAKGVKNLTRQDVLDLYKEVIGAYQAGKPFMDQQEITRADRILASPLLQELIQQNAQVRFGKMDEGVKLALSATGLMLVFGVGLAVLMEQCNPLRKPYRAFVENTAVSYQDDPKNLAAVVIGSLQAANNDKVSSYKDVEVPQELVDGMLKAIPPSDTAFYKVFNCALNGADTTPGDDYAHAFKVVLGKASQ